MMPYRGRRIYVVKDPPEPPPEMEALISRVRSAHREELDLYRERIKALEQRLARKQRGRR